MSQIGFMYIQAVLSTKLVGDHISEVLVYPKIRYILRTLADEVAILGLPWEIMCDQK
jgi:hypothetical protein